MTDESIPADSRQDRLSAAIAEYLRAVDAGEAPSRERWLARFPEVASDLGAFFDDQARMNRIVEPLGAVGPSAARHRATALTMDSAAHRLSDTPTAAALGRVRYFGDYELLEEIARGGMGVVFKARQTTLKRIVALKMILTGQLASGDDVKRFYAEAEAAAKLEHPNIVPIFEIGQAEGQHYFSMALVQGESLAHRIARGVLTPREAATVMHKVARAIAFAHVEGVVHRDLKPANILLDAAGEPHVTDFGLAKRVITDPANAASIHPLTATGQILGTPSYMPPEQASGRADETGPLADVYSLGAVLYCLITGRPPFQAASPLDTLLQVIEQDPVAPRLLNPAIPRDLETICLKCLNKEPRQRYGSAAELADDIERFTHDEPIRARRPSAAEQAGRWLRKQRRSMLVAAAAAASAVMLVFATICGLKLYELVQIGHLRLKTEGAIVLTAEVLNERGELELPPFTVPTKEPIALRDGTYRIRLSGSGALSESFLLDVVRGQEHTFHVALDDRTLGEPVELRSPDDFTVVDFGDATDFLVPPRDMTRPTLRRVSGTTGKSIWEVNWQADATELADLLKSLEDQHDWRWWVGLHDPILQATNDPRLLVQRASRSRDTSGGLHATQAQIDLNDDGIDDLVFSTTKNLLGGIRPPSLVALSGKDGQPLWWVRSKDGNRPGDRVVGDPVVVNRRPLLVPTSGGGVSETSHATGAVESSEGGILNQASESSLVIALFAAPGDERWFEAFGGETGQSRWRQPIRPGAGAAASGANPTQPTMCVVGGKQVIVTVLDTWLIGVDAETGQSAWQPYNLRLPLNRPPQFGDLDGDGQDDVVTTRDDPTGATPQRGQMIVSAVSLATQKTLWETTVSLTFPRAENVKGRQHWPYVADLDSDGRAEVIVPNEGGTGGWESWVRYDVLDGATGRPRWQRRFHINFGSVANSQSAPERFAAGPDIDGDGHRELFVVSTRLDPWQRENAGLRPSRFSLFVDAFSGKDGRTIWWNRVPLGDLYPTATFDGIGLIAWGAIGGDGWPQLVVSTDNTSEWGDAELIRSVHIFATGTGRLEHWGENFWRPHVADFDRDGLADLCAFVPYVPKIARGEPAVLKNSTGKLHVFRGTPPEAWRRFGAWSPAQDIDGDGTPELFEIYDASRRFFPGRMISGRNGRTVARWKIDWDARHTEFTNRTQKQVEDVGRFAFPSLPAGDLDGDGTADALVTAHYSSFGVDEPLFLPVQAISGRTGQRVWTADRLPIQAGGRHLRLYLAGPSLYDLDGDPATPGDVIVPFHLLDHRGRQKREVEWHEQVWLTAVSARDRVVRWSVQLADNTSVATGIAPDDYTTEFASRAVDVNADGTLDLVLMLGVPKGTPQIVGEHRCEVIALDGRTGAPLWRRPLQRIIHGRGFVPFESPAPIVADLDADGSAEVITHDELGASPEGWQTYTVMALDGPTGEPKWTWEYKDSGNWSRPRIVLADLDGDSVPSVCISLHESAPISEIVALDGLGQVAKRFDGGARVENNYAVNAVAMKIWPADLDGDGMDEFVYLTDGRIRATRGGMDDSLWEWPLPGGSGGIREIRPSESGRPATVIVEAAGSAPFDEWGLNHLNSHPPLEGIGKRGDSILALDGRTGQPIWRGRRDPINIALVAWPGSGEYAASERVQAVVSQSPLVVSRATMQFTVARTTLPADPSGQFAALTRGASDEAVRFRGLDSSDYQWVSDEGLTQAPSANDPRLLRRLPWMPPSEKLGTFYQTPIFFAAYSLAVLLVPGSIVWLAVRRGTWTVRGLLAIPVAVAVALASYELFVKLPLPGNLLRDIGTWQRLGLTIAGLPILALPTLLILWTMNQHWRKLVRLFATSAALSVAWTAFVLWVDSRGMDPSQSYSWDGWWLALFSGAYLVTMAYLAAYAVARLVRAVRARIQLIWS